MFPVNPWPSRVPEKCEAAILDCRVIHGILWVLRETFLKAYTLKEDCPLRSSTIQRIWHHHLDEKECESRRVRQYLLHVLIRAVHPWILTIILEELILSMVWWITRGFRCRECISENSLTQMEFQSCKVNFKTEVCSKSADPQVTMQLIKDVEIAKSIDELMTSRSTTGRIDFTDYHVLDAMIASALKKLLINCVHFWKRVSVEEQKCSKNTTDSHEGDNLHTWSMSIFEPQGLRSCTRSVWTVQCTLTQWRCSEFRRRMGSSSIVRKWDSYGNGPGRFIQGKITGFCSASDRVD